MAASAASWVPSASTAATSPLAASVDIAVVSLPTATNGAEVAAGQPVAAVVATGAAAAVVAGTAAGVAAALVAGVAGCRSCCNDRSDWPSSHSLGTSPARNCADYADERKAADSPENDLLSLGELHLIPLCALWPRCCIVR